MRDILFRGKHIHALPQNEHLDGTWVYGYLCDKNHINTVDEDEYAGKFASEMLVDPETVCQYIGVCDRNHRRIFEGDIVRRRVFNGYIVGEVVWLNIGFCGFYLKSGNHYYPMGKDEWTLIAKDDEVIGTVFDNPELIGGQAE